LKLLEKFLIFTCQRLAKTKTGFVWNIASGILQIAIVLFHKVHNTAMLIDLFDVMILDHRGKHQQEDSRVESAWREARLLGLILHCLIGSRYLISYQEIRIRGEV